MLVFRFKLITTYPKQTPNIFDEKEVKKIYLPIAFNNTV